MLAEDILSFNYFEFPENYIDPRTPSSGHKAWKTIKYNPLYSSLVVGIEHRIATNNFYFNETKGFFCLRNDTTEKCLRESKGRKHPRVDPLVISKLRKFFAEHNQKFYELVGVDLGWPEE